MVKVDMLVCMSFSNHRTFFLIWLTLCCFSFMLLKMVKVDMLECISGCDTIQARSNSDFDVKSAPI